jgi:DtxR family Mn-dependent transcriptional regulator
MEHAVSEELEAVLKSDLANPQVCPHGNPLPGFEHVVQGWQSLPSFEIGSRLIIRRVHELAEQNPELLAFLEENLVMPGKIALVKEDLPFNQTMTLEIEDKTVTLGYSVARYIFGEPLLIAQTS